MYFGGRDQLWTKQSKMGKSCVPLKEIKYSNKQETAIWVPLAKVDKSNAK